VFQHDNPLKVLFAHAHEPPPPLSVHCPTAPSELEAVVMKCLEKDPRNRFADIAELEQALSACRFSVEWTQAQASAWWSAVEAASRGVAPQTP
jgi:serine/threonine-protein kinase